MGLIPLVLTVKESTLLLLAVSVVMSIGILAEHRGQIRLGEIGWVLAGSLISRIPAYFVLDEFGGSEQIKRILGAVLILMAAWLWLNSVRGNRGDPAAREERPAVSFLIGFAGGFTGGLFAVGGPIFALYFLYRYEDKRKYIAGLQMTYLIANLLTLGLHGASGDIGADLALIILAGSAASWLGVRLGVKLFGRLPAGAIRKFALVVVILSGLNLVIFTGG